MSERNGEIEGSSTTVVSCARVQSRLEREHAINAFCLWPFFGLLLGPGARNPSADSPGQTPKSKATNLCSIKRSQRAGSNRFFTD